MAYIPKTNWVNGEIVKAADLNRIEQGIKDASEIVPAKTVDDFNKVLSIGLKAAEPVYAPIESTLITFGRNSEGDRFYIPDTTIFPAPITLNFLAGKTFSCQLVDKVTSKTVNYKAKIISNALPASGRVLIVCQLSGLPLSPDNYTSVPHTVKIDYNTYVPDVVWRSSKFSFTGTLIAANWEGTSAPYTNEISIPGLLKTDVANIDLVSSDVWSTSLLEESEWGKIKKIISADDTITFYAAEKPTISLNFQGEVIR